MNTRPATQQLGELLLEAELVTPGQLARGLAEQRQRGGRLARILMDLGYFTPKMFQKVIARHLHYACIDLENYHVRQDVVHLLPEEFARERDVLAIDRFRDHISIGMACPMDRDTIARIEAMAGAKANPFLCNFQELEAAFGRNYTTNTLSFDDLRIRFSTGDRRYNTARATA